MSIQDLDHGRYLSAEGQGHHNVGAIGLPLSGVFGVRWSHVVCPGRIQWSARFHAHQNSAPRSIIHRVGEIGGGKPL